SFRRHRRGAAVAVGGAGPGRGQEAEGAGAPHPAGGGAVGDVERLGHRLGGRVAGVHRLVVHLGDLAVVLGGVTAHLSPDRTAWAKPQEAHAPGRTKARGFPVSAACATVTGRRYTWGDATEKPSFWQASLSARARCWAGPAPPMPPPGLSSPRRPPRRARPGPSPGSSPCPRAEASGVAAASAASRPSAR